jgi:hypothetical protein
MYICVDLCRLKLISPIQLQAVVIVHLGASRFRRSNVTLNHCYWLWISQDIWPSQHSYSGHFSNENESQLRLRLLLLAAYYTYHSVFWPNIQRTIGKRNCKIYFAVLDSHCHTHYIWAHKASVRWSHLQVVSQAHVSLWGNECEVWLLMESHTMSSVLLFVSRISCYYIEH